MHHVIKKARKMACGQGAIQRLSGVQQLYHTAEHDHRRHQNTGLQHAAASWLLVDIGDDVAGGNVEEEPGRQREERRK